MKTRMPWALPWVWRRVSHTLSPSKRRVVVRLLLRARHGRVTGHRPLSRGRWRRSAAAADCAAVPDANHLDHHPIVVDRVDDPIDALPHAIPFAAARQLLSARTARIVAQGFDASQDATDIGLGYAAQVLRNRRLGEQFIGGHRPSACRGMPRNQASSLWRENPPQPGPPGLHAAPASSLRA